MQRARSGRAFWTGVVEEFEGREPRPRHMDYAAEKRVCVGSFRPWLYRLRRERAEDSGSLGFVPVELVGQSVGASGAEMPAPVEMPIDAALPGGVILRWT